jgi:predicted transcriptional regulator
MARKRSPLLTDGEVRLMNVLWDQGQATVADVAAALKGRPPLAYTTVQTLLGILEEKGFVTHEKSGRAFVYRALVDRQAARRTAVGHLVKRFFDNSPSLLVQNLLKDEKIDQAELEHLKKLLEKA